jgi:hypothetical protein
MATTPNKPTAATPSKPGAPNPKPATGKPQAPKGK